MTKLELNAGYGRPVDKLVFTGIAARLGRSCHNIYNNIVA
jgi:hypothetical protein